MVPRSRIRLPGRPDRRLSHPLAQLIAQGDGGGLLDHLLMIPLDGAVPLSQMDHISIRIRQDLELDVPRVLDKMLDIHGIVPERHLRFLLGRLKTGLEFLRRLGHPHSLAAAAKGCFDDHRIADLLCDLRSCLHIIDGFFAARDHRDARRHHGISRLLLVSKPGDHLGFRPDKGNVALLAQLRKFTVLREKSKSRMDGVRAGDNGSADDPVHAQITLAGGRRPDTDRLVRQLGVKRLPVRLRVDGHRLDAHLPAGSYDPHRDLAPVGN